ncbi:MAG TPA: Mg2+ and Co2+ transporter CorB [Clostridiaceae bacterium]|nr:Mg2+ and Co2+ transporter CorB [Clostridiaceae bacterium]
MEQEKSEKKFIRLFDRYRELANVSVPVKKSSGIEKKHIFWGFLITIVSFTLSILILFASTSIFKAIPPGFAFFVVLGIILIGVAFDAVGTAVTAADETPFHSMASKKMRGAKQSIMLLRNSPKVSSFCNDVVGDICSVVSGAAGTAIVYRLFTGDPNISFIEPVCGALIAAMTVGGKAFAKNLGINNANYIVYKVGRLLSLFSRRKQGKKCKKGKHTG